MRTSSARAKKGRAEGGAGKAAEPRGVLSQSERTVPSVTVRFDYSQDTSGFFNDPARNSALERSAAELARGVYWEVAVNMPGPDCPTNLPPDEVRQVTDQTIKETELGLLRLADTVAFPAEAASIDLLAAAAARARMLYRTAWGLRLNVDLMALGDETYEQKQGTAKAVAARLREAGFAIAHPETGGPCVLQAISTDDPLGRYVLKSRAGGRRTHSSRALRQLLPFSFCDEAPPKASPGRPRKGEAGD